MDLEGEAIGYTAMVQKKKGRQGGNRGKQQSRGGPAPAPAPASHPGTGAHPFFASSNRGNAGVVSLTTLGGAPTVKAIELADAPGEGHFSEALAKALGPRAKDPPYGPSTARHARLKFGT